MVSVKPPAINCLALSKTKSRRLKGMISVLNGIILCDYVQSIYYTVDQPYIAPVQSKGTELIKCN